jgi:hypothetical protein
MYYIKYGKIDLKERKNKKWNTNLKK